MANHSLDMPHKLLTPQEFEAAALAVSARYDTLLGAHKAIKAQQLQQSIALGPKKATTNITNTCCNK